MKTTTINNQLMNTFKTISNAFCSKLLNEAPSPFIRLKIENFYSDDYNEKTLDEVVLIVKDEIKERDLPEWLLKIKKEHDPKLLKKLNAFVKDDYSEIERYDGNEYGYEYYDDGELGSYKLMLNLIHSK